MCAVPTLDTVVVTTTRGLTAGEVFLRCLAIFGALGAVVLVVGGVLLTAAWLMDRREIKRIYGSKKAQQ